MDTDTDMDDWDEEVSGLDILRNLETVSFPQETPKSLRSLICWQLKAAISKHFKNIHQSDTCFGADHAELLKRHIDQIASSSGMGPAPTPLPEKPKEQIVVYPWTGSFAPRVNPFLANNIGKYLCAISPPMALIHLTELFRYFPQV